jgi:hypothetical protein
MKPPILLFLLVTSALSGAQDQPVSVEVGFEGETAAAESVDATASSSAATPPGGAPLPTVSFFLYHSFGGEFTERGRAVARVKNGKLGRVRFDKELELAGAERKAFEALLETNGLYRLRVSSVASDSASDSTTAMTSIRACELVMASFKEEIKLMIDNSVLLSSVNATVQPTVLSIAYGVPPSQFKKSCPKEAARYKSAPVLKFQTAATVVRGEPGQALAVQPNDGAAANGKPPPGVPNGLVHSLNGGGGGGGGGSGGGSGGPGQNQSFLRKYWYIVLPLMLMLLSPGPPDEGGQQQAGAGGGGGSGGGGGGAAAAR